VYIGKATFPHGLDYDALIPDLVLQEANQKIAGLYQLLKKEQLIEEIMRKEVPRIGPHVSLYEAAQMMKTTQSGILAIIQDDDLVGVITERDLVIRGYAEKQTDSIQVENITSSSLYSVDANYSVAEAIRIMVREKISGVPVVKNGVLVGMVTLDDLAAKNYFA
jgi:CBS domain-containing protein